MVQQLKMALRKEIIAKRDALTKHQVKEKSRQVVERLLADTRVHMAKTIAIYLPKGNEVDLTELITKAITHGKRVLAPVTSHNITFCKVNSLEELAPGKFGILEPKTKVHSEIEPDLIFVPGVCFGGCMHRLGYGRGYYDKYLGQTNPKAIRIGICYDFQIIQKLPTHEHDIPMDEIISEKRVIRKQTSKSQG